MSNSITVTAEHNELLDSIKQILAAGQLRAARAVNNAVAETYCPDRETSEFHAQHAVAEVWTRPVLQTMIASRLHERTHPALTTFDQAVPEADREEVRDSVKDHRYVVFELKLGRFEPEYVGKLNFYVQLVDDHLRDRSRDDPTLGMLLVVGRDDVTVEVALRGVSTPLAVTEWRRLSAKVRQALPTAEDLRPTVTRTVREHRVDHDDSTVTAAQTR